MNKLNQNMESSSKSDGIRPSLKENRDIPDIANTWLTEEIKDLLADIPGPHVAKKRQTVIRLGFALANQQPVKEVFSLPETCDERIWYMKWQYDPQIRAAFDACYQRALEWSDETTAVIEAHYRRVRRQSVAKLAADAPAALASVMKDQKQPGSHRISAANALMTWADPEAARTASPAAPASSMEQYFIGLSEDELDNFIGNLEAATGGGAAGETSPADSDTTGEEKGA